MARNSTIWKIKAKGRGDIYLAGTMHLKSNFAFRRKAEFLDYIRIVDQVITETDIKGLEEHQMQDKLLNPGQLHLRDVLSQAQYKRYNRHLNKTLSIDLEQLGYYQPMLIQNFITQLLLREDQLLSLDHFIHSSAQTLNKVCTGLESPSEQQAIFEQIDFHQQLIMLKRTLSNISKFRKQQLKLAKLYMNEEIHKLYQVAKKSAGIYKDLLIYNRNDRMTKRIMQLNPNLSYFIAIGAAHLPGEKGLLHLLNQSNFTIEPLYSLIDVKQL